MDYDTILHLNAINQTFYKVTASDFNQTRGEAWPGWEKLLPYLHELPAPLTVLDVGCGNGRFGVFLHEHLAQPIHYYGVDSNPTLLAFADKTLAQTTLHYTLEARDVIQNPLEIKSSYTLVVAFGVLHHVPGYDYRQTFVRHLTAGVDSDGLFVFATWRFYEHDRFRERIIPWDSALQVEKHDYLLDWQRGATAVRYCHYVTDDEQQALIKASGFTELITYRADGKTNDLNCYSVLRRPSALD